MRATLLFFIIFLITAFQTELKSPKVYVLGSIESTAPGKVVPGVVSLDSLRRTRLYALGALENSEGQIIITNGIPRISTVINKEARVDKTLRKKASFLIYSKVKKWKMSSLPSKVRNYRTLEAYIAEEGARLGIDLNNPVPFKLTGQPISVHWHITGTEPDPKDKRKKPGINDIVFEGQIEVLGFYSENKSQRISLGDTNMHMHFRTRKGDHAGHVDDIKMVGNMNLYLPDLRRLKKSK